LNLAAPNYSLAHDAVIVESGRATAFAPDVLLVVGHGEDLRMLTDYVWRESTAGRAAARDEMAAWVRETNLHTVLSNLEANRRLRPYHKDLARWAFGRIAAGVRAATVLVYALIPEPLDRVNEGDKAALFDAARASGFAVIDLERVYEGYDRHQLIVSEADHHPNRDGHRVIADRLYAELTRIDGVLTAGADRAR
jgi:hypothetical protein